MAETRRRRLSPHRRKRFLELLAARDFERLGATLASDAHARFLLPHGLEEYAGRDAIVRRIESWFGSASVFDLTSSTEDEVGMRHRLSWRFSVVRDGSRQVIEQLVYLDLGPQGIEQIDLLCSGFQKEPSVTAGPTQVFDAGAMGCADGLAQEFRRQIAKGSDRRVAGGRRQRSGRQRGSALWQGCSGSGSRQPRRTTTGASPSLWRDRNEREAHLQLHLGP